MTAKVPAASPRENRPVLTADDREAVKDQRRGVVSEAFAFQHQQEPPRQPQPARHGQRRDHVRWRYDGAEQEADRPGQADQVMRRHCDRAGGEDDAAEGEQEDRPQIEAEFPPAHGDAGGVDQRRQDHQQHELRGELDARQTGDQGKANAGDDQEDGRRNIQPARQDCDGHQHRQQQQQDLYRHDHG